MAKKNIQNNSADAGSQAGPFGNAPQAAKAGNNGSLLKYAVVIVVAGVLIALAYYALSGSGGQLTSRQIFSNVSSANLNHTQSLFVNDLMRSENVSDLYVSYYSSNATQYVTPSSNLTIAITSNQTIDSYKLGNYNATSIISVVAYKNSKSGVAIAKNVSEIYYYSTNATITCFNDTSYSSTLIANASLQCASGDQGQSYLEETPFTAVNVSSLSYLVFNNTVTYGGTKKIAGRGCDDFVISNATASNLRSNYTIFNLCIDTQYGIPLYLNDTTVVNGLPSSFAFTATAVSAAVTSSELAIPPQYLNAVPKSII
jgi:hypothetical protein